MKQNTELRCILASIIVVLEVQLEDENDSSHDFSGTKNALHVAFAMPHYL